MTRSSLGLTRATPFFILDEFENDCIANGGNSIDVKSSDHHSADGDINGVPRCDDSVGKGDGDEGKEYSDKEIASEDAQREDGGVACCW